MLIAPIQSSLPYVNPYISPFARTSVFANQSQVTVDSTRTRAAPVVLDAPGTNQVSLPLGQDMPIDSSGVMVHVDDLRLSEAERKILQDGSEFILPAFTAKGAVTIRGTAGDDVIKVSQDASGNTRVEVTFAGSVKSLNLGRIAALTLDAGDGNDKIQLSVKGYYGGVTVNGGSGDDRVSVNAVNSLRRGVTITGGAGDDRITLSGAGLNVLVSGNAGNDLIEASRLAAESGWSRQMDGGDGSDLIIGSDGSDTLRGGDGDDTIMGRAGDDALEGGDGDDTLVGDAGDDRIQSGAGNDLLMGGDGDDTLSGGSGNVQLYAGDGHDALYGGVGVNTLAPAATLPFEITAYGRSGGNLRVLVSGAPGLQPEPATWPQNSDLVIGYKTGIDYLIARHLVIA